MMLKSNSLTSIHGKKLDLSYFVEWRKPLWSPAVRWLLDDPKRFAGKRVLELGCRHGRMSSLFALLGAQVQGVEVDGVSLDRAREEVDHWGVGEQVSFANYDGDPSNIPGEHYDFVFTKSVLVVVPELQSFLTGLCGRVGPKCELMIAENLAGGRLLNLVRSLIIHRRWRFKEGFHGVDQEFFRVTNQVFDVIEIKKYHGLVACIRAQVSQEG